MLYSASFFRTLEINFSLWREIYCANGILGACEDFFWAEDGESELTLGEHIRVTCIKPEPEDFHPAAIESGSVQEYLFQNGSRWEKRFMPSIPGLEEFLTQRATPLPPVGTGELLIIERERPESLTEIGVVIFKDLLSTAEKVSKMVASPYERIKVAV